MTFQGDDKILRDLVNVARSKKEIRLLNIFTGIPITYEAAIQGMDERGLTFSVFKKQSVCLELDKLTFIECDSLPYTIKARVVAIDIVAGTAIL